jgi:hypothetical protein
MRERRKRSKPLIVVPPLTTAEKREWLEILRGPLDLSTEARYELADILEEYIRREEGQPGRPLLDQSKYMDELVRYGKLIQAQMDAGESYKKATETVANRERVGVLSLRRQWTLSRIRRFGPHFHVMWLPRRRSR